MDKPKPPPKPDHAFTSKELEQIEYRVNQMMPEKGSRNKDRRRALMWKEVQRRVGTDEPMARTSLGDRFDMDDHNRSAKPVRVGLVLSLIAATLVGAILFSLAQGWMS